MDLTTYSGLVLAILDYLNRDDLSDQVPGYIRLAEAQISRRVRAKTVQHETTVSGPTLTLPENCIELRALHLDTGTPGADGPIHILTPTAFAARRTNAATSGRPRYATVIGQEVHFAPAPSAATPIVLTFYEKLVPLSPTTPNNSTLLEAPDVYLFGALKEAEPFLEHDERVAMWTAKFEQAVNELNIQRERQELAASLRPQKLPVTLG